MEHIEGSIQFRNRFNNSSDSSAIKLMITLRIMYTTVEITPLDTCPTDMKQCNERFDYLLSTLMLCSNPRLLIATCYIYCLTPKVIEVRSALSRSARPPPPQPCPKAIRQTLQRRPSLSQRLAFFIDGQRLLCK